MNVALRPEHLNILSICTGGGGLDLGIELAVQRARTVCMVEREAYAVAQLVSAMEAGHLAPAPIWSDARTFDGRAWRGAVDGLIGGIPCQPHSAAGKRLADEDERDLWSDARRIIIQSRAWFVVIENVRGIMSSGGAERVWRDLHRLGFEVEGGLFTASEVGASHDRERIFILAVAAPARNGYRSRGDQRNVRQKDGRPERGLLRKPSGTEHNLANTIRGGYRGRADGSVWQPVKRAAPEWSVERALFPPSPADLSSWCDTLESAPELEPAFRRVADGLATRMDVGRVDRLRMLGNGVVPLQAAYALRTLVTRLAARGSAGAARLVRMMEGINA